MAMSTEDRVYFVRRAAEEMELAETATDPAAIEVHRALQRRYIERASVGERMVIQADPIG